MIAELIRLAEADQAAKCALAVGRGGVEQDACHRPSVALGRQGVDALANTGSGIPTFQRELTHQRVRKRMQEHIAQSRVIRLGERDTPPAAPGDMGLVKDRAVFAYLWSAQPRLNGLFAKLDKNALTAHLGGGYPVGQMPRNAHDMLCWQSLVFGIIAQRLYARKAGKSAHCTQAFAQDDLPNESG